MAVTTGNGHAAAGGNRLARSLPPYWERLEPLDGGYQLTHADGGRPMGEIRVFDDQHVAGEIHVQFTTGRGKGTKVATIHCDTVDEFRDLIEALSLAEKQLVP